MQEKYNIFRKFIDYFPTIINEIAIKIDKKKKERNTITNLNVSFLRRNFLLCTKNYYYLERLFPYNIILFIKLVNYSHQMVIDLRTFVFDKIKFL